MSHDVLVAVAIATAAANLAIAVADVARARFVLANSAEVRVPPAWLPWLASAKAMGAIGLIVGVLWLPGVAVAAAIGLTLFFVGALAAHVRAGVYHNIAVPGAYLVLAVATLVLALATGAAG